MATATASQPVLPSLLNPCCFPLPVVSSSEEEDPIVHVAPVYLSAQLSPHLHLFQFPLCSKPLTFLREARVKRQFSFIELDFQLPVGHPTYDEEKGVRLSGHATPQTIYDTPASTTVEKKLEKVTWSSSLVPLKTKYFIGTFNADALHLTPVHGVLQFSPNFKHLDTIYQKEKEVKKKVEEEEKKARGEVKVEKKLFTQLPRIETEEMIEERKKSITYWRKEREREAFSNMVYFHSGLPESEAVFTRLFALNRSPLIIPSSSEAYLNAITPTSHTKLEQLNELQRKLGTYALEDLKPLDLETRLYNLLVNARILPFDTIMYILNPPHPDALLQVLTKLAVPLPGVWILASHYIYKDRTMHARDYLISLFHASTHRPPRVFRKEFAAVAKLDVEETAMLLSELAHLIRPSTFPEKQGPEDLPYWELKYEPRHEATPLERTLYALFEQNSLGKLQFK